MKQKLLATLSRHHPKSSRKDQEKADWQFLELVTPSAPNSDHAVVVSTEQGASICTPVQARAVYNLQFPNATTQIIKIMFHHSTITPCRHLCESINLRQDDYSDSVIYLTMKNKIQIAVRMIST